MTGLAAFKNPPAEPSTAAVNLRRLVLLRLIVLTGQVLAVGVAPVWLQMELPLPLLGFILATGATVNLLTWWRLRRPWPVGDAELFAHLAFEVLMLTTLLYFTGGSTNPFTSLYLLLLTLTAAALPWRYTWMMAAITVACYTVLLVYYIPLPAAHDHDHAAHTEAFQLHVLGMWLVFILSATLIAYFVVRMRETVRERDRLRARMREQELKHERVLALGTLAAGAAHELGTPLSTMAVLAKELARDQRGLPEKLQTLRGQIDRCKEILSSLAAAAGQTRAEGAAAAALDAYLTQVLERWRAMRPDVRLNVRMAGSAPAPHIAADQALGQALGNILSNAADVSPHDVEIDIRWGAMELALEVRDRGCGLTAEVREHAGEPFFSTKAPGDGMGLGLFLARGTIERLGGEVELENREGGGAVCRVQLPLHALRLPAHDRDERRAS